MAEFFINSRILNEVQSALGKGASTGAISLTNWALLVRSEGSDATEFLEMRQNACAVWSARGKPYTSGEKDLREFSSTKEAEAFLHQAIAENQAQGLELVHIGCATPGKLDFELLEKAVHDGACKAYQRICAEHPHETISGFSLFTDSDGMTIIPVAMSETSFTDIDEGDYYRTNPAEWPYFGSTKDGSLLLAYRIIIVAAYEYYAIPFEIKIPLYFEQFSEMCIRALERLESDGLFGSGARREDFLLLFGVADGGPTRAAVKRLNPEGVYQRYANCFDEEM